MLSRVIVIVLIFFWILPVESQNLSEFKIEINGKEQWDRFGNSVAIDLNHAGVGFVGTAARKGGYAYFYRYDGNKWNLNSKVQGSDTKGNDIFGTSIDIDGNLAIVGARGADVNGVAQAGSAYIFQYNGNAWTQEAKIYASDYKANSDFGMRVAIKNNLVVVGAHNDNDTGAVYIFRKTNGVWAEETKIKPSRGRTGDEFGWRVAFSGSRVLVGSEYSDTAGTDSGIAYIYEYVNNKWQESAILAPSELKAGDRFGSSVEIRDTIAFVGARNTKVNGNIYEGAAYYYKLEHGQWLLKKVINAPVSKDRIYFGTSISIGHNQALITASGDVNDSTGFSSGIAHVYDIQSDSLKYRTALFSENGQELDGYGFSSDADGINFIIGANDVDSASMTSTGEAFIYRRTCSINNPLNVDTTLCIGDSILINGINRTTSGTYQDTLEDNQGCDSVIRTKVTFVACLRSISEFSKNKVSLYPNPTTGMISVKGENIKGIQVYNLNGTKLKSTTSSWIDLSEYDDGLYFLRVQFMEDYETYRILLDKE